MRWMWMATSVLALVFAFEAVAEDKGDASKLIGTWTITGKESSGTKESGDKIKGKEVKITREKITCNDKDGKCEMACRYEVDTSTTPWKVEMTCTEGEHKGKKMKGIVQLSGDTMKVCYAKPDGDTPSKFTDTKEGQCCLTLRRAER